MRRRMVFVTVVFSSILWLAGAPNAHATPTWCGLGQVQAAELPQTVSPGLCDLQGVVVRDGLAGAVVPEPGTAVEAFVMGTDGTEDSLAMQTAPDGTVTVLGAGDDPILVPVSGALTSGSGSPAEPATAAVDPNVDPSSTRARGRSRATSVRTPSTGLFTAEHDTHKWYIRRHHPGLLRSGRRHGDRPHPGRGGAHHPRHYRLQHLAPAQSVDLLPGHHHPRRGYQQRWHLH